MLVCNDWPYVSVCMNVCVCVCVCIPFLKPLKLRYWCKSLPDNQIIAVFDASKTIKLGDYAFPRSTSDRIPIVTFYFNADNKKILGFQAK